MLQVYNSSPFQTGRGIVLDVTAAQIWVVVIKATYAFDDTGQVVLADEQEPVCLGPEHFGDPATSGLRREAELAAAHPGTDVTLNATAYPTGGRAATSAQVTVDIAGSNKQLLVTGDRVWRRGPLGIAPSEPEPFLEMPIRYERAFGGTGPSGLDPRNPVGTGFAPSLDEVVGQRLPNIEDPRQPVRSWRDRPPPAGLGAIASGWSPRRELGGTFDDAWKRTRAPHWPADHDPLFHRSAPTDQWSEQPLRGGERLEAAGVTRAGRLTLRLPYEAFLLETRFGGRRVTHDRPSLDRVIVDVDERRLVMVWCVRLACGTRGRQVEFTSVELKRRLT